MIKDSNITIMVKNMDQSILFYQSIGFNLKNRWGDHYAQMVAPGITIGIHPATDAAFTGSGNISIGFTTGNFEETKKKLDELSISTESRYEEGGRFLHFKDPDGMFLYFIEPNGDLNLIYFITALRLLPSVNRPKTE